MSLIDERLASEEESDMTEEDKKYLDATLDALDLNMREIFLKDPFDTLILVRGFQTEVPRLEETIKNFKAIAEWRKKVDFDSFLLKRFDRDEEFHKYWPEKIYGHDKYGHLILGSRISEIITDEIAKFSESEVEILHGQRLSAIMALKRERFASTGKRRYKHTAILDLAGVGMSLLSGRKRGLLKLVTDIGTDFYPETAWKIYIINAPLIFRAIWTVVKPWLHPITLAKIKILGTSPERAMELDGECF